ncbi:MAG: EAL domain-containing protein [Eubacteriaceae bacterium]|jgi:EAL domain-containing protein (putative c-di-GMP-specific phosphodiesterase class I)/ActR/RegA family two-component response regulator/GGDEF domain-containing protein|nr:EAL domain-containing protein [Eubacteriaceae bacterium]
MGNSGYHDYPALKYFKPGKQFSISSDIMPRGAAVFAFDGEKCFLCYFNGLFLTQHGIELEDYYEIIRDDALDMIHPDDRSGIRAFLRDFFSSDSTSDSSVFRTVPDDDSRFFIADIIKYDEQVGGMPAFTAIFHEASPETRIIERLEAQKEYEIFTGFVSPQIFCDQIRVFIENSPDAEYIAGCIGMSKLRVVHDLFGDAKALELLRGISTLLHDKLLPNGLFARWNADTFVFVVYKKALNPTALLFSIDEAVFSVIPKYRIRAQLGLYEMKKEDAYDPASALHNAQLALHDIASDPIHRVSYFNDDIAEKDTKRHYIISEMEQAFRERQFVVYYQPIFSATTRKLISAEALVRWLHPERGIIPPGDFIPIFEQEGFITKLDVYIWEEVCKYIKDRQDRGRPVVPISVNMSRLDTYNPRLTDIISGLTAKYHIRPKDLRFEITESTYSEDPERIQEIVRILKEKGFSVLMDDFGSGYSSLAILKNLDIDVIKIDRGFVLDVTTNERASNVLGSVIRLTRRLHIPTVVEGVETKEQFDYMRGMGCDSIQGFYFARPDTAERLSEYIEQCGGTEEESDIKAFARETTIALAPKGEKKTILIVDDQPINRILLRTLLEDFYEVQEADNGKTAIDMIKQNAGRIDLVLLDIVMPIFNGFDFLEEARAYDYGKDIPVIVMTEADSTENEIMALEYGANDFIKKPYHNETILLRVANQLKLNELTERNQQ